MTDFPNYPYTEPLIFDSHAHYDDAKFDEIRAELLAELPAHGVCGVVNCGCDTASSKAALALAEKYPYFYAAVGIHPDNIGGGEVTEIEDLARRKKCVAIGEIGLDYYWVDDNKEQQRALFEEQLVFVCHKSASYQDGILPSQLNSTDEIYIPWSNTFLMWHDYWFGNDPEVKVMLDNMALLRQLLDLKDAWAIMPATLGHKLAENENCRIVSLENGPEYRTCYAIMNDQRNAHPLVTEFLQELLNTVSKIPEIRLLDPQYHQNL